MFNTDLGKTFGSVILFGGTFAAAPASEKGALILFIVTAGVVILISHVAIILIKRIF